MTHGGLQKKGRLHSRFIFNWIPWNRDEGDEIGDLHMSKWLFWWLERVVC